MKLFPLILLAFIATVSGVCEDDLLPLEAEQLPAVWNVGAIPHIFFNSAHLRGVSSLGSGFKITDLDTVKTSLHFCPVDMTIYGNLTIGRFKFIGNYTTNLDYINHGSQVFGHGGGFADATFANLQLRNLVAPIRYSTVMKRLQIHDMQYEAYEEFLSPKVPGFDIDDEGRHWKEGEEFKKIDENSSFPTVFENLRAILNAKFQKGILVAAVKQMFGNVFSI